MSLPAACCMSSCRPTNPICGFLTFSRDCSCRHVLHVPDETWSVLTDVHGIRYPHRKYPPQTFQKIQWPFTCPVLCSHECITWFDNQTLPPGVPSHGIKPAWLGKYSESIMLPEARIFMSNFGESFMPSTTARRYSNTPVLSAPPEVHFAPQIPLSIPADIWSLTCTVWSIFGAQAALWRVCPDRWLDDEGACYCAW